MRTCFKILTLLSILFIVISNSGSAEAKSYFVDSNNGNDSNTGLSHAQSWKTLNKVNNYGGFIEGDDVYLLCGETWLNQNLAVDWSGSPSNPVTIGSYYVDEGIIKFGFKSYLDKPVIDGGNKVPSYNTYGLVTAEDDCSYIIFQDLVVKNSAGDGIEFQSGADYGTVQRCKISNTYRANIDFYHSDFGKVEHCDLSNGGLERVVNGEDGTWPCGGIRTRDGSYTTSMYNKIYNQYGEGLDIGDHNKVMYNLVVNTKSQGIYVNARSNAEIAYNLVIGTDETIYEVSDGWHGAGITLRIESDQKQNCRNNKIHHNVVINTYAGIRISNQNDSLDFQNNYIYNNTFIDNRNTFHINNPNFDVNDSIYVKNNISYAAHSDSNHMLQSGDSLSNWKFSHNVWAIKAKPKGEWTGIDDSTADPGFSKTKWRGTISDIKDFNLSDLVPTMLSLDMGVYLGTDYAKWINSNSNFNTDGGGSIAIVLSSEISPSEWPIGAISFSDSGGSDDLERSLCPPKNISVASIVKIE